jgi:tRNA pseudouridine55 synthase
LSLRVVCSSGTYVRTLGEVIAESLGTVGYLTRLHRLWVEPFEGEPMHTLDSVGRAAAAGAGGAESLLLPVERALAGLVPIRLDAEAARRLAHGQKVPVTGVAGLHAVYGPGGRLLGLGGVGEDGLLQARRLFTWAIGSKACASDDAVERDPGRR